MRILMIGNSFTFYHDIPRQIAAITGAEVHSVTRGGAAFSDSLKPEDELHDRVNAALQNGPWDYVVLQEQSSRPVLEKEIYLECAAIMCRKVRQVGAVPVIYGTWAYREGSEKLQKTGLTYEEMAQGLRASHMQAAKDNDALFADVGSVFTALRDIVPVYEDDDFHPAPAGAVASAFTLAKTMLG
ncbi:MAG: SGNH/GDSL hydrolase family protein [Clostridiales bacterium]|nr:SGNH/GDSL hydrolase family protein [Clostridiales bacterium]